MLSQETLDRKEVECRSDQAKQQNVQQQRGAISHPRHVGGYEIPEKRAPADHQHATHRYQRAKREKLSLSEVERFCRRISYAEAKGDQGINAAERQTAKDRLKKWHE